MAKNQPRIVRGRTELWVPHNAGEIAFASPAHKGSYLTTGKSILQSGQKVPTGDYTASLLHAAYYSDAKGEPEFTNVRDVTLSNWLSVYNQNLWTDQGVYVVQDTRAEGLSRQLDINQLEKGLKGARELSWGGVRISNDGRVRFAPAESYVLEEVSNPEKDGFVIASCNVEGARKMADVSQHAGKSLFTYGLNIQKGQKPKQRVLCSREGGRQFRFDGSDWGDGSGGLAFGVWV